MYIHELKVRNFLIHRSTSITLSPITVLIGPNGGGKSALFDAILNFSMLARGSIRQAFGHYPYSFSATRYRGGANISRIGFDIVMSNTEAQPERLRYSISYSQQGPAEAGNPCFQIFSESLKSCPGGEVLFTREDPDASPLKNAVRHVGEDYGIFAAVRRAEMEGARDGNQLVSDCARQISRFNRFRLSPIELARPSRLPDISGDPPRLGYEGEDLAACLYYMSETSDPALATITDEVRAVLPGFREFEFNIVGVDRVVLSMSFSDGRGSINAARMSHGNLIFLGLMVLTYSRNRPPVMLIEEPENGLTPAAGKSFYRAVRRLALREEVDQRSQILISSHSPFILCEAWNGEDRDFIHQFRIEDGKSCTRKLSDAIAEQGVVLGKDEHGQRTVLSLKNAEELMSGYLV